MTIVMTTRTAWGAAPARARVLAGSAAALGTLHVVLAPEYLLEAPYLGVGFLGGGTVLIWAALAGLRSRLRVDLVWAVAAAVSAGMLVGGIASRTIGLPGYHPTDWEPALLVSLALAVLYLLSWGPIAARRQGAEEA